MSTPPSTISQLPFPNIESRLNLDINGTAFLNFYYTEQDGYTAVPPYGLTKRYEITKDTTITRQLLGANQPFNDPDSGQWSVYAPPERAGVIQVAAFYGYYINSFIHNQRVVYAKFLTRRNSEEYSKFYEVKAFDIDTCLYSAAVQLRTLQTNHDFGNRIANAPEVVPSAFPVEETGTELTTNIEYLGKSNFKFTYPVAPDCANIRAHSIRYQYGQSTEGCRNSANHFWLDVPVCDTTFTSPRLPNTGDCQRFQRIIAYRNGGIYRSKFIIGSPTLGYRMDTELGDSGYYPPEVNEDNPIFFTHINASANDIDGNRC